MSPEPQKVAEAAERLLKAADAMCVALDDHTFTDEHYRKYIDAAEEMVKTAIKSEAGNSRFLTVIMRAVADELENY